MKLLLIGLLSLLGATSLALIVRQDPGYVLIDVGGWTVETAFSLFVLFILALFLLAYIATRFLARLWKVPARTRQWRDQRRLRNARAGLDAGLLELAEGNWAKAQKQLSRSARYSETPLLHYLGAARAAQQQSLDQRRDTFLQLAAETVPGGNLALGITRAELQLQQNQLELARQTLNQVRELAPGHQHVLALLARLHLRLEDWTGLEELLPDLRRHKVKTKAELDRLEDQVLLHRLLAHADADAGDLEQFWNDTPKRFRADPEILRQYLHLVSHKPGANHDAAAREIGKSLKKHWDQNLLGIFGQLQESDSNRQFLSAEAWLPEHPTDARLLLVLGVLASRNRLWGKARSYLESSLALNPNSRVFQELGNVLLELGEPETAARRYREGLELATGEISKQAGIRFDNTLPPPRKPAQSDPEDQDQPLSPESIRTLNPAEKQTA